MQSMRESLFYADILAISIEGYMEYFVSGYLNVKEPLNTTFGEKVSTGLGFFCLAVSLVALPLFLLTIVFLPISVIKSESFQSRFGGMTENLRKYKRSSYAFNFLFVARRYLFLVMIFEGEKYPAF